MPYIVREARHLGQWCALAGPQELNGKLSGILQAGWHHIGSWKSATVEASTPWKLANALIVTASPLSSVQPLSRVWLFVTPWIAARQASLSITSSQSLLKPMSIESVMPSSHLILLSSLSPLLSPIPPSIRVFSNESTARMRWPKDWSFSFIISPSNEHPGLISFRMDWLDLLLVQGTLKSLLQNHSSKASIFQRSAFFTVQLSHPYMTTGKTIALTRQTFVGKVTSLLFNMLSRLAITFLPRSKCLWISWLQSPSAVILEPKKIKSGTHKTFTSTELWSSFHLKVYLYTHWDVCVYRRRQWQPTPVLLPGKSHG